MSITADQVTGAKRSLSREAMILEILGNLQQLVRDSRTEFKRVARDKDLTFYQASALIFIFRQGGEVTMSAIADALHMPPSTVTSIVDALLMRGLVDREPAADDRRSVVATMTVAGRELVESFLAITNREFAERFDEVPDEALGPFLDVMIAVNAAS